ncbi:unnamed protein product [Cutaneotrichosporon oleaginosum]
MPAPAASTGERSAATESHSVTLWQAWAIWPVCKGNKRTARSSGPGKGTAQQRGSRSRAAGRRWEKEKAQRVVGLIEEWVIHPRWSAGMGDSLVFV